MSSEKTAAAAGGGGEVRFDPFAMLPFMGYNIGDYIAHWLEVGAVADPEKLPRLYWVNWFRRDANDQFMWPGFGENCRVLAWVCDRLSGTGEAVETPIGLVPSPGAVDCNGLTVDEATMTRLVEVDPTSWRSELSLIEAHYQRIGGRLPEEMSHQLEALRSRLGT